jgi:hypothetical protein
MSSRAVAAPSPYHVSDPFHPPGRAPTPMSAPENGGKTLILTPRWPWHELTHEAPSHDLDRQPRRAVHQSLQWFRSRFPAHAAGSLRYDSSAYGMARPVTGEAEDRRRCTTAGRRNRQKYRKARRIHKGLRDGIRQPLTGGPTFPTRSCWIQMKPGSHQSHRHQHYSAPSGTASL